MEWPVQSKAARPFNASASGDLPPHAAVEHNLTGPLQYLVQYIDADAAVD